MADNNFESYAGQSNILVEGRSIDGGEKCHDTLKFSNCTDSVVRNCTIFGGIEDCIDINRGSNILIENCHLTPRGLYGITVKGGFKKLILRNVVFVAHGKEADIDAGNWSDQDWWTETGSLLLENVTAADGKPVVVRQLWALKPMIKGGNVQVKKWKKLAFFYFVYKTILSLFKKLKKKK